MMGVKILFPEDSCRGHSNPHMWVHFTEPGECISWQKAPCQTIPSLGSWLDQLNPPEMEVSPSYLALTDYYPPTSPIFFIDSIGEGFLLFQEVLSIVFFIFEFLHSFLVKWDLPWLLGSLVPFRFWIIHFYQLSLYIFSIYCAIEPLSLWVYST